MLILIIGKLIEDTIFPNYVISTLSGSFIYRTAALSKGEIAMPKKISNFLRAADEKSLKREFDQCIADCHLVGVFCEDNFFRETIKKWTLEAKKKKIHASCIFVAEGDAKKEEDLLKIILKSYEGIDICFIEDEEDVKDLEDVVYLEDLMSRETPPKESDENEEMIVGAVNPTRCLLFNPPDKNIAAEICKRWNYSLGNCYYFYNSE